MIKDVGSSNGTFVNGTRLSEEAQASDWVEIKSDDTVEFGIDILNEDGTVLYKKVSCQVKIVHHGPNANEKAAAAAAQKANVENVEPKPAAVPGSKK